VSKSYEGECKAAANGLTPVHRKAELECLEFPSKEHGGRRKKRRNSISALGEPVLPDF
jgi:hypothetical protein